MIIFFEPLHPQPELFKHFWEGFLGFTYLFGVVKSIKGTSYFSQKKSLVPKNKTSDLMTELLVIR